MIRTCTLLLGFALSLPLSPAQAGPRGTLLAQATGRQAAEKLKQDGDALLKAGKRDEAEQTFRKAIEADPTWYVAFEALGNLQFAAKRYADAVETFEKAIAVEPRYHTGMYNIAFAQRKAGAYEKAVEYYKRYIDKQPQDPDAYYGLASAYDSLGKKPEAMQAFQTYVEKETRPAERQYVAKARTRVAELQAELGKPAAQPADKPVVADKPAARPADKPVVADKPAARPADKPAEKPVDKPADKPVVVDKPAGSSPVAELLAKGDRAMAEGSFTLALKSYFDAVQLEPKNTEALYKLGLVYLQAGNSKAARLKWESVLKLEPGHAGATKSLAALDSQAKPAVAAADKPADKPTEKPADKPADKPVDKPADKPMAKPADKPADKPVAMASKVAAPGADRLAQVLAEGDTFFQQKAYTKAITSYTHATQLQPDHEEALFKLGVAYAMSGNFKVAVFKWEQVLKLNPNNQSALRNIEKARTKLGAPAAPAPGPAAAPGRPAAAADPELEACLDRAQKAKAAGNAQEVLAAAEEALRHKKDARALVLKGEALVVLQRHAEAKRVFSDAMVADPTLAAPFYGLGEASRLSGDLERARYYFQMYLKSGSPDVSPELTQRAKAFLDQK